LDFIKVGVGCALEGSGLEMHNGPRQSHTGFSRDEALWDRLRPHCSLCISRPDPRDALCIWRPDPKYSSIGLT
jgi:hypothetical protein